MEFAVMACVLAACASPAGPPAPTPSWTMYRGDLARDGRPPGVTLDAAAAGQLTLIWKAHLDGAVDGTPAIAGGLVVAGSAGGTLAGLDSVTGEAVWSVPGLGAIADSPAVAGDRVYAATLTGHVYAFGLRHGERLWEWTAPPDSAFWSSPVVYRDLLIVAAASPYGDTPLVAGRLFGLDAVSGRVRWTACVRAACAAGDGVWSTPAIDARGTAFVGVGNPDDAVLAFDPLTGQRMWMHSLYADQGQDLDVGASPVVFTLKGREAIGQASVQGTFTVLDAADGGVIWSRQLVAGSAVHGLIGSPAYDGSKFFVASASSPTGLFALDPNGGSTLWRHDTPVEVYSSPAVGDGVVVFGSGSVFGDLTDGSLLAVAGSDGRVLWSYDTRSAVRGGPALAGDLMVAGDYAGDVMAFRPRR